MNVTRTSRKYAKKSSDHEKPCFQLSHVSGRNERDRECECLTLDHQPCQLSELSCIDTYHIGKSFDDHDYKTEEILFDFEEDFYGNKHFYKPHNTKVRKIRRGSNFLTAIDLLSYYFYTIHLFILPLIRAINLHL